LCGDQAAAGDQLVRSVQGSELRFAEAQDPRGFDLAIQLRGRVFELGA